jgi:hypothetical protein
MLKRMGEIALYPCMIRVNKPAIVIPSFPPIREPLRHHSWLVIFVIPLLFSVVGCSAAASSTTLAATPISEEVTTPPYNFATLDTVAALGQFDPIPELRVYLQETDPAVLEGQVRGLFGAKGYAITVEERSGNTIILQFERDGSIYAVRIAPLPDAPGQSLQISATSTDLAFNEKSQNESVPASFWQLSLGDCVLANDVTQTLEKSACDQPHFGEVVGAWNLPDEANAPFPGDETWLNTYTYECANAFEAYTGDAPTGDHPYWYSGFGPTPASWVTGDRAVICLLFHADGLDLTHSAQDEFK